MKKLILFLFLLLPLRVHAAGDSFFVQDEANLLSTEVKESIVAWNEQLAQLDEQAQVVVMTIPSLNGESIEQKANNIFNDLGIGNKDYDNGVLILLAEQERKIRIEVGYGLEDVLTDSLSGQILDANLDALSENNFNDGLNGIFELVIAEIAKTYDYEFDDLPMPVSDDGSILTSVWIFFIVVIVLYSIIPTRILKKFHLASESSSDYDTSSNDDSWGGGGSSGGGGASRDF